MEIVQAYLLLALWGCGAVERFEMDKTWMLLGMGIRSVGNHHHHRVVSFSLATEWERERFLPSRLTDSCLLILTLSVLFLFFYRMATDLNLHRKSTIVSADTQNGKALDMEIHNRERTWIMCFVLDRSYSSQMGKPHSIREESVTFLFAIVEHIAY